MVDVLLDAVSKQFDDVTAVSNVTLRVGHGESVVLLGPTGSGKTTLLRLIAGLEEPTSGDILFDGLAPDTRPDRRNVTMLFAENRLYPKMSARSNIGFPLSVRKTPEPEKTHRVEAEAGALGIEHLLAKMPHTLSAGESNLVHLAKAMVRAPGLFLIDEPFGALDVHARRLLRTELRTIQQGYGVTAIYATNDQEDAMTLADRLVILDAGRIQQLDSPIVVYARPQNVFVATFVGSPSMTTLPASARDGRAVSDNLAVEIPSDITGRVLIGVRPEDWVSGEGLRGTVVSVDDLGSVVYTTVDTSQGKVVARRNDPPPAVGSQISLIPNRFHVFEAATGKALFHSGDQR